MNSRYRELKAELDTGWPWPLDAVQNWFEDLWNWIAEAAYNAISALHGLILDWAGDWFRDVMWPLYEASSEAMYYTYEWTKGISEPLRTLFRIILLPAGFAKVVFDDVIAPAANWLYESLTAAVDNARSAIEMAFDGAFNAAAEAIGNALKGLGDVFKPVFEFLHEKFSELFKPVFDVFGDLVKFFTEDLPKSVSDFVKWVQEGFKNFADKVYGFVDQVIDFIINLPKFLTEDVPKAIEEWSKSAWSVLVDLGSKVSNWINDRIIRPVWEGLAWLRDWIVNQATAALKQVNDAITNVAKRIVEGDIKAAFELLAGFLAAGLAAQSIISVAGLKVVGSGIEVGEIGRFVSDLLNPSMITGVVLGVALAEGVETPLRQFYARQFRLTLPSTSDLRDFYLREYVTEEYVNEVLAKRGYTDEIISAIKRSWWIIPGVRDLITFVVREVIKPEEFYDWAKKQGLSEYWARNYWEAHWVLPSFENLREAFWRGIITEDEFRKYVVWHDYKPEPRPGISKSDQDIMSELSYKLPGRIDARWMVRWGIIDKDGLKRLTRMEGMHPEWIDKVAEAEFLNQLLDERTRVKSEYYSSFTRGTLSREKLDAKLREVRFIEEEIKYLLDAAGEARRRELIEMRIDTLKERWKRGQITRSDFESELRLLGVEEEYIKELADTLETKYAAIEVPDLTKDERKALASEYMKWFSDGLSDEETLRIQLEALGLSPDEINYRLQLANKQYEYKIKKMLHDAYIDAYRRDEIDESKLIELLTGLGLRADYINKRVEAERMRKRRERVQPEKLEDKLERLQDERDRQLAIIQDLQTDLEAQQRIYDATVSLWSERIARLQEAYEIEVDPEKKAKIAERIRETQIKAYIAITRQEARLIDIKEKLEYAQSKLDEINSEIEVVRAALGPA